MTRLLLVLLFSLSLHLAALPVRRLPRDELIKITTEIYEKIDRDFIRSRVEIEACSDVVRRAVNLDLLPYNSLTFKYGLVSDHPHRQQILEFLAEKGLERGNPELFRRQFRSVENIEALRKDPLAFSKAKELLRLGLVEVNDLWCLVPHIRDGNDLLQFLLQRGADVNWRIPVVDHLLPRSILAELLRCERFDLAVELMNQGAKINSKFDD